MKKIITLFVFCLCASMTMMNGQALKVIANGNVGINNPNPTERIHILQNTLVPGFLVERQDGGGATLNYVKGGAGSAGSAFFYDQNNFFTIIPAPNTGFLGDGTSAAKSFTVAGTNGFVGIGTWTPTEKLEVVGNIKASGTITPSDKRLKKNINKFSYGLQEVMKIKPVTFAYNGKGGTIDGDFHVGVIAQELQKVVPEFVKEYEQIDAEIDGINDESFNLKNAKKSRYLSIKDSEIKYLLINSIKEQQEIIESQGERILALEKSIEKLTSTIDSNNETKTTLSGSINSSIGQNRPNPFDSSTEIDYNIPKNVKTAEIAIFNQTGQIMKRVILKHTGSGTLKVSTHDLPSGTYSYSLILDGNRIDSHKMVKLK